MDANLTWKYHINKTLSNPIFYINIFLNTSSIFCTETLYHSMVHGHLTYGIQVWSGCTSVHKLMKLPKRRFTKIDTLNRKSSYFEQTLS